MENFPKSSIIPAVFTPQLRELIVHYCVVLYSAGGFTLANRPTIAISMVIREVGEVGSFPFYRLMTGLKQDRRNGIHFT